MKRPNIGILALQGTLSNQPPTDIALSVAAIAENNAIGAIIGALSTTDADVGDTFTYTLVSGTGSTDNASFTIDGANLKAGIAFNFEAKSSYSIRVRSTDDGGKYFEKAFTITITNVMEAPTGLTSSFTVDTILGQLNWTDNEGGAAEYEVYSNTNGAGRVLLATTAAGATSYQDTTCKQNASVVYEIRAKEGVNYSDYVAASAIITPLCWKTDQSTLTTVVINVLNIIAEKSVTVNYSDGTSQAYTGSNTSITKDFADPGQYNIWLSGDINYITSLSHVNQIKSYGNLTNWIIPINNILLRLYANSFTGIPSEWIIPATSTIFQIHTEGFTGSLPNITGHATNAMNYQANGSSFSDSGVTVFRKAMTVYNISNQNVVWSTEKIDAELLKLADWYQANAPTANCTFTMNGANMGIPTGGANNVDLLRLASYYVAAGKTPTIVVRTV